MCFIAFLGEYDGSLFRVIPTVTLVPCLHSPLYEDQAHSLPLSAKGFLKIYSIPTKMVTEAFPHVSTTDHLLKVSSVKVTPKLKVVTGFSILSNGVFKSIGLLCYPRGHVLYSQAHPMLKMFQYCL